MFSIVTLAIYHSHAQGFQETVKIVASDRASNDYFGGSVDVSGDYAIVGEICDGLCAGAVYIYQKEVTGNWSQVQKIVSSDLTSNDFFGSSVSIDGDYAIIAAYGQDKNAYGAETLDKAGAAYIFKRNTEGTWVQEQKIVASDRAAGDQFGHSASISGNYAIVGANFDSEDADGNNYADGAGSAYIYKRDEMSGTWSEVKKIVASNRIADAWFGRAVAISGDYAVVGAYWYDSRAGAAYIFQKNEGGTDNWGEIKVLEATDLEAGDWFGVSVDIYGSNAVVCAYNDDVTIGETFVEQSGSAFVFNKDQGGANNWGLVTKLVASDATQYDTFGRSVSMIEDAIVIGAYGESHDADGNNEISRAGSAYVFIDDGAGSWIPFQKIVTSDRAQDDSFGESVGISNGDIIVGANYEDEDTNGENTASAAGSAYLFSLTKVDQTISFDVTDKSYGESFLLNASTASGLPVSYSIISGPATINGDELTATEVGEVTVEATQAGNNYYNAASPVQQTFTINKADQTITFSTIEDKTYGDAPFSLSASASSGLSVSFSVISGPATLDGTELTITGTGEVVVEATQEGNDNYLAAESVQQILTVNKADQTIIFDPLPVAITVKSLDFELSAVASSGLSVSFTASNGLIAINGNLVSVLGPGEVTIIANQSGNDNFNAAEPVSQILLIDEVLGFDQHEIKLYPNPVYDYLTIDTSKKEIDVEVYDYSGMRTSTIRVRNNSVDLSRLESGPYILQVKSKGGQLLTTRKIVKQ